jgi:hypothetical protein
VAGPSGAAKARERPTTLRALSRAAGALVKSTLRSSSGDTEVTALAAAGRSGFSVVVMGLVRGET